MSIFSQISAKSPRSNTFDLSHDRKFSMNFGRITPILALECVPGDSFNMSTSQMLRMAPMVAPVMHSVNLYTHFFFVPNRLVWDGWEDFITGGEDGQQAPVFPTYTIPRIAEGSVADYLGLPIADEPMKVSALPFAMYQLIWNEYYRDQNNQTDANNQPVTALTDGDNTSNFHLLNFRFRAWQHDYFTSALPWTQKGPEATIPIADRAPIGYEANASPGTVLKQWLTGDAVGTGPLEALSPPPGLQTKMYLEGSVGMDSIDIDNSSSLYADLSSATASSINDLRRAFKLQEWLEKNARGGSRYIETIKSHFGVTSPDARLQRPEFLGGGSAPITISEVLQTSDAEAQNTPLGNMAGHGISAGASTRFSYRCTEHGYIMGFVTVMPKPAYFQGIPKHFLKWDKFDYYWGSFAHLGEQPIQNKELYFSGTDGEDDDTFGYTPRYAEYKYLPSSVHGAFRTSLDFWHLGRKFANRPKLNADFIKMNPAEVSRIFAVETTQEQLYVHMFHRIKAKRLMPYFGTPTI